ncbi:polyubiquitin-tagged protein recognition complex, Npl4 component [Metschnikowia bicuspidata]|uniref:Nuclear protein localization protein 4 n=1 Tax=Metschnikowia bicuspidata TaxID=27322 RepID=A0A4P9ZEG6_9ASCO|nr:polyubiquitin-tagged protein recognition complex, Npl4 component [Metschnikowia bicuspidata]
MILRFRFKDGTIRVTVDESQPFAEAIQHVLTRLNATDLYVSTDPTSAGKPVAELAHQLVKELELRHGDMLFVTGPSQGAGADVCRDTTDSARSDSAPADSGPSDSAPKQPNTQLPVDDELDAQSGAIPRKKSAMCRHSDKGMCEYCSPLPPWDKTYLDELKIKHKSFHAHIKELRDQSSSSRGSAEIAPLKAPRYAINTACPSGHAPYPAGICSNCQPAPITLQQQTFRMVDHVEFAAHGVLNDFIDAWRRSGMQRYGILYGRYERYDSVPLGIKAIIEAIYEPPQACELDGITLLGWRDQTTVDEVAAALGLYQVGVVFTDLTDARLNDGAVLCKRHKDSFFLLCVEVLMAARNQTRHPNACKHAETGQYSSKFVTCVVTGNARGEIETRVYQVSAGAEALVQADHISASTQPNMVCVKPTQGARYVPEVFYLRINEYGLEVKENARPAFPVDFLLVTLLESFPVAETPMFRGRFPVENRDFMGVLQNLQAVRGVLRLGDVGDVLADFHLLVYLLKKEVLSAEETLLLLRYVRERRDEDLRQLVGSSGWMTLETIVQHSE